MAATYTVKISGARIVLTLTDEYGSESRILSREAANALGRTLTYASEPRRQNDPNGYQHTITERY